MTHCRDRATTAGRKSGSRPRCARAPTTASPAPDRTTRRAQHGRGDPASPVARRAIRDLVRLERRVDGTDDVDERVARVRRGCAAPAGDAQPPGEIEACARTNRAALPRPGFGNGAHGPYRAGRRYGVTTRTAHGAAPSDAEARPGEAMRAARGGNLLSAIYHTKPAKCLPHWKLHGIRSGIPRQDSLS